MQIMCTSYAAETDLPRVVMVDSSLHFHDIILRHNRAKSIRRLSRFGALHFASRINVHVRTDNTVNTSLLLTTCSFLAIPSMVHIIGVVSLTIFLPLGTTAISRETMIQS